MAGRRSCSIDIVASIQCVAGSSVLLRCYADQIHAALVLDWGNNPCVDSSQYGRMIWPAPDLLDYLLEVLVGAGQKAERGRPWVMFSRQFGDVDLVWIGLFDANRLGFDRFVKMALNCRLISVALGSIVYDV